MADHTDRRDVFVDRAESKLNSWHPAQINAKKVVVRRTAVVHTESQASVNRSELNVEISGVRESHLTSTTNVVTNTVRTVYGRSLSGSTSSTEDSSAVAMDSNLPVFDTHSPTQVVDGGIWENYRKKTESHFISQTYHVDPPDSPSKSVTAIQNVMFRCHKEMDLKPHHEAKVDAGYQEKEEEGEQQLLRFVDRCEEIVMPEAPAVLGSPGYNSSTQRFMLGYAGNESSENRLKQAREEVKHMIETSYIANDISDVIDDLAMSPRPTSVTQTESSVDKLPVEALETMTAPTTEWTSQGWLEDDAAVQVNARPTANLPSDKDSPRRLSYSPGLAIRSYALEELAEKKSKDPLESLEKQAKSLRFDTHSSQVDLDRGSSVDDTVTTALHATETSQSTLQPSVASSERFGTTAGAIIPEQSLLTQSMPYDANSHDVGTLSEEERRESEDKLENLVDITAGYRFHDVGMMLELNEGICNPAFDATDDQVGDLPDGSMNQFSAQDHTFLQMEPEHRTVEAPMLMSASTATSLQSSPKFMVQPPSSPDSCNQGKKVQHSSDSRSNAMPSWDETISVSTQPSLNSSLPVASSPVAIVQKKSEAVKNIGPPVQVTRQFTVTKKFESSLKSLGARLKTESFHIDVYYDTPSFDLTSADSWLRTHNGKWQFHANFTTMYKGEKCRYVETEEVHDVLSKVNAILNSPLTPEEVRHSVALYVQKSGLREFVRYTTTSKTYQLGDLLIELVMPQYGFWTGSVTSTAPCKAQTHKAVGGIDELWRKTGVTALSLVSSS